MQRIDIHWSTFFTVVMVGLGFMSCGLVPLVMWLTAAKDYPRAVDTAGVTLRNGQHMPWSALTKKQKTVVQFASGNKAVTGVRLHFGNQSANIAPKSFREGDAVLDFISQAIGEDLRAV